MIQKLIDDLIRVTQLEVDYRVRPPLDAPGTPSAVMLLLSVSEADPSEPLLLLTRRTEKVQTHKGQYAFPGGVMDPEDRDLGGLWGTALRELEEEMGIARHLVRPVGELPGIWTPSGFSITPVVGVLLEPLEKVSIVPSPHEIDLHFWVRLSEFAEPGVHAVEMRRVGNAEFPIEVYQLREHRIWGATGAMLKNFLDRFEKLR